MESVSGGHPGRVELVHWPAVGPVDLFLPGGTAIELNIAKLGCAIAEGAIGQGMIVAGAPPSHWANEAPGGELFAPAVHDGDALVRRYERWWRFWCKDVLTRPIDLPSRITVADAGSVWVALDGVPFTLRAAGVSVTDAAWHTHVCPTAGETSDAARGHGTRKGGAASAALRRRAGCPRPRLARRGRRARRCADPRGVPAGLPGPSGSQGSGGRSASHADLPPFSS
jgi:hypothetical protein